MLDNLTKMVQGFFDVITHFTDALEEKDALEPFAGLIGGVIPAVILGLGLLAFGPRSLEITYGVISAMILSIVTGILFVTLFMFKSAHKKQVRGKVFYPFFLQHVKELSTCAKAVRLDVGRYEDLWEELRKYFDK
ncbi:hypothetical protein MYX65_03215 [Acidobacteria bacterium AH-259-L09]|nr:hypothetical protein [Acidobacteria bacterium AH-259-L09]